MLHLTKVAVGCGDVTELAARHAEHAETPGTARSLTRFMPKRAGELVGGSLFWIIRHRIVARQAILGLEMTTTPWGVKCAIALVPGPVPVAAVPCRAHQGWRYLAGDNAPPDADGLAEADVPAAMLRELQALWLV